MPTVRLCVAKNISVIEDEGEQKEEESETMKGAYSFFFQILIQIFIYYYLFMLQSLTCGIKLTFAETYGIV